MTTQQYHTDCSEYLPTDVFKGFCTRKKSRVMADDKACEDFQQAKKCKLCKNYDPTEEYLGLCMGKTIAYPEMLAKTCEWFHWKDEPDG